MRPDRDPGAGARLEEADVILLLEGTYPYVRGGVSKWVHDLLLGMPETRFGIVFLGATADSYGAPQYSVPANVVFLETHYLLESAQFAPSGARKGHRACQTWLEAFHAQLPASAGELDEAVCQDLVRCLLRPDGISTEDFLFGKTSWDYIRGRYEDGASDQDFVSYFWTVRSMHNAVFKLARIARRLPRARVLHAVSTGYAGLLGTFLALDTGAAFILSEHGIYTKERKIDLQRIALSDRPDHFYAQADSGADHRRGLWIRFFQGIGRLAYARADPIIALYEGNRRQQLSDGAPESKTRVIPNGISVGPFARLRAERAARAPRVVGLLGRLVPIKDVKSFVRAMCTVSARCPDVEGWLIGPTEEDPDYVRQCRDLVRDLGLDGRVKFLGFQDPKAILPQLGVLVLSSISEAFPLVILEAWASGLPVIATDVGACRELIEGSATNGRALGVAGRVVPIADPEALAAAAIDLLNDPAQWHAAQQAGIRRVERYYRQETVISDYRRLYQEAMG
ncbi:GT4 family glycosyltransferase PelF [Thiocystis violacea]|uniref:GT4 family glycosyltransferase PelF n=1 Tax=Thiocystis violacea TaxID=13725 RepID=UPI0019083935|nr:GT4 family glycosyltransferase PelF [Thiocystis violacea]MBK1723241.1 hypothetical protein [Thiocystis violacea]